MPIQFVYFDVGQVLVNVKHGIPLMAKAFGLNPAQTETVWNLWGKYTEQMCLDTKVGKLLEEEISAAVDYSFPEDFNWTTFAVNMWQPIQANHLLAAELSKKYPVGILSNAYEGMIEYAMHKKLIPSVAWETVIDSYAVGLIKPDEKIFALATQKANVQKNTILFIDDNPNNIVAAKNFGWQAIEYDAEKHELIEKQIRQLLLN